jgi:hypothetical protein
MIKKFSEFVNEYSPNEESFFEKFGDLFLDFEAQMKEEGMDIDPDTFSDTLDELDALDKNETELDNLFDKWYTEDYVKSGTDEDNLVMTDEYHSTIKKFNEANPRKPHQFGSISWQSKRNKEVEFLMRHSAEKHWDELKKVYQKWIDFIDSRKGFLAGKQYGI